MACHTFQRTFLETLLKEHPKVVIGFEFFTREHDELLERWRLGTITEQEFLEQTDWYGRSAQNFGFTKEILDLVREKQVKTIGLNVSRTILRTV